MATEERKKPIGVLIVEGAVGFGGSIVSTAALARAVDPQHYRITIAIAADKSLVLDKLGEAAEQIEVIQVRPFFHYDRMYRIRKGSRSLRPKIFGGIFLKATAAMQIIGNIPWMLRIGWIVVSRKADIIQFNNGFGRLDLTIVTRLVRRQPVVFFRGYTPMGKIDRRLLLPRVRACVAVSEHVKQLAVADGVDPKIVHVATPPALPGKPIDPSERLEVRKRYGIPEDALVVAIFGRIIDWKGQLEFLKAGAEVIKRLPDTVLMLVGSGHRENSGYIKKIRNFIAEAGIADKVVFSGFVTDVDSHYQAADVIAHASIAPEPSGRVIFEAMQNGVPVVASSLGGPKEFIDDSIDGFIVEPSNTVTFAARMHTLLTNASLREEFVLRAHAKLQDRYGSGAYKHIVQRAYDVVSDPPNQAHP